MKFWSLSSYRLHFAANARGSGCSLIIILVVFTSVMSCSSFRQDTNVHMVGFEQERRECETHGAIPRQCCCFVEIGGQLHRVDSYGIEEREVRHERFPPKSGRSYR